MTILVNVRTKVNSADIRKESRNGRDVIIVPSATLPDNVIMNGGIYPPEEIEKAYKGLERTPAPFGHPMINNAYVPSKEIEAINEFWIGAHNENVRRENGRVLMDKVIDIETAKSTEKGRRVLNAVDRRAPIHTSTGIYLEPVPAKDAVDYSWIATNMKFDHDAILLDQEGAATPEDGVGMMVNSSGTMESVEVKNGYIERMENEEMEFAADIMVSAMERGERERKYASMKQKLMGFMKKLMSGEAHEDETPTDPMHVNQEEGADPMITKEQIEALEKSVSDLTANQLTSEKIAELVSNAVSEALKPVTAEVAEIKTNMSANEEAEKTGLVAEVVKSGLMKEETAKDLSVNALKEIVGNSKPRGTDGLFPNYQHSENDPDDLSDDLPGAAAEGAK